MRLISLALLTLPAGIAASCNADNCLRALRATGRLEAAQSFCATFTIAADTATRVVPTYAAAACTGDVSSRVSSACSCIATASSVTNTSTVDGPNSQPTTSSSTSTPTRISSGSKSCLNPQLSCQNTTVVKDLCCFNAPGGQLLQTQFWDTSPSTGPSNSWTIHGLWPDHCDGTYDANCDPARAYTNITAILQSYGKTDLLAYMNTYWKDYQGNDESFWEHEWGKHGTCISTLEPSCYTGYTKQEEVVDFFAKTVSLFQGLDSYTFLENAGILPSTTATYTSAQIQAALTKGHGFPVTLGCSSSALDEIWYHYDVRGSVQTGDFVATSPDGSKSTCPDTGVKYLPKNTPPSSATTTPASGPTGTPTSWAGKGYVQAYTGGKNTGCLIGAGTWYSSGTCATYAAAASGAGFTLTSSKGPCSIISGALTCAAGNIGTAFTSVGGNLAYGGSANFYAAAVPAGSVQQKVLTTSNAVEVSFTWQGL